MRKPNTNCFKCNKDIYKRPNELEKQKKRFCGSKCYCEYKRSLWNKECQFCKHIFKAQNNKQRFCSKVCVGKSTKRTINKNKHRTKQLERLNLLKEKFDFNCCMVENCDYNKVYDLHRLISGKDGGLYEIGNMFAICPNHHAEFHRGIIDLIKISDCKLKILEKCPELVMEQIANL